MLATVDQIAFETRDKRRFAIARDDTWRTQHLLGGSALKPGFEETPPSRSPISLQEFIDNYHRNADRQAE
jgi:hypothetical protein